MCLVVVLLITGAAQLSKDHFRVQFMELVGHGFFQNRLTIWLEVGFKASYTLLWQPLRLRICIIMILGVYMTFLSTASKTIVLIVEDEYRVALAMSKIVRGLGYTTLIAKNIDAARAMIQKHQHDIHIVIADYGMRGPETGLDFLKWLESQLFQPVRILVSGLNLDPEALEIYEHCHYFLEKPFNLQKLQDVLSFHQPHDQLTSSTGSLLGPTS